MLFITLEHALRCSLVSEVTNDSHYYFPLFTIVIVLSTVRRITCITYISYKLVKSIFQLLQGSGGSKTVPLKEGEVTDIQIEVTAEDGTIKKYFVHVKRLSAKDATLSDLKIDKGAVQPGFSPDVTEYTCKSLTCMYDCHTLSVIIN